MSNTKKRKRSHRLPRSLADQAMRKLYDDEDLTDLELQALFESDYLRAEKKRDVSSCELFKPSQLAQSLASNILFLDTQKELISYFSRHPEMMFSLPPRKFEELIASVFKNHGFEVELTPETRDGGIDIIAVKNDIVTGRSLHLVECKRYSPENKVGIGIVQRMMGVVDMHRATQGMIVTTSGFSSEAYKCAEISRHRLGLSAYSDITTWLRELNKNA